MQHRGTPRRAQACPPSLPCRGLTDPPGVGTGNGAAPGAAAAPTAGTDSSRSPAAPALLQKRTSTLKMQCLCSKDTAKPSVTLTWREALSVFACSEMPRPWHLGDLLPANAPALGNSGPWANPCGPRLIPGVRSSALTLVHTASTWLAKKSIPCE